MSQATKEELENASESIYNKVFEPGATNNNDENDVNKQLEEMKKLLAEKDAEIASMKQTLSSKQNENDAKQNTTVGEEDKANDECKSPPKTDVTLSLRGIPEYDQYPHGMSSDKFYFMASIKAPYFRSEQRTPIDLIVVADESGSMNGDRIKLVKQTVQFIIKNLESNDRFGIVGYSNGSRIVLPLTKMDNAGKKTAQQLADGLKAQGGTALCAGLVMGVNMMRQRKFKNDVASVMILTDGQANQGPTSAQQINDAVSAGKHGNKNNSKACTINSFGFGSGHNESLLESIAENGKGMYAFIETTDMIADTFAECLGGLVSIIGQDLRIKVAACNDIEINKCLSDGYTVKINKIKKEYEIHINNLQSEENRDLIFELKVPKLNNNGNAKMNDPIIQLSVQYKNVVRDKQEVLSNVCCINRIDGQQIGERNIELDVQYNRILAADAMDEADKLANKGKLDEANKILTNAQKHIGASKSKANKFSKALVSDIQTVQNNMRSKQQYRATGGKMLKMNKKAHKMQRSVQSSKYASQSVYQNRSKGSMKRKFKPQRVQATNNNVNTVRQQQQLRVQQRMNSNNKNNQNFEDIYVGNLHEAVANSKNHIWTMFVSKSKDKLVECANIEQVEYSLHPTFNPSKITVKKSPFLLKRKGWGIFEVDVKITFKNKKDVVECSHVLDFDYPVSMTYVGDKKLQVYHSKELKKFT